MELMQNLASGAFGAIGAGAAVALLGRRRIDEARRDPMTGLDTRAGFETKSRRMLARTACTVLMIDLDGLKSVNDSKGHEEGDSLICSAAAQIVHWLPSSAVIGRLGGDEFAAVYPLGEFSEDNLDRLVAEVPMSVGVVVARSGDDYSVVLKAADAAMYLAKSRREGGWVGLGLATSVPPTAAGRQRRNPMRKHA